MAAVTEEILRNQYDLPPLTVEQEGKDYWLGTLPTCPQFNIGIAGIMFHRYTDPPTGKRDNDTQETKRTYRKGSIEKLNPSQVAAINAGIQNRVVQWRMKRGKEPGTLEKAEGFVITKDSKQYTRSRWDEPLAKYVFCLPLDEASFTSAMSMDDLYPDSVYDLATKKVEPKPEVIVVPQKEETPARRR